MKYKHLYAGEVWFRGDIDDKWCYVSYFQYSKKLKALWRLLDE